MREERERLFKFRVEIQICGDMRWDEKECLIRSATEGGREGKCCGVHSVSTRSQGQERVGDLGNGIRARQNPPGSKSNILGGRVKHACGVLISV